MIHKKKLFKSIYFPLELSALSLSLLHFTTFEIFTNISLEIHHSTFFYYFLFGASTLLYAYFSYLHYSTKYLFLFFLSAKLHRLLGHFVTELLSLCSLEFPNYFSWCSSHLFSWNISLFPFSSPHPLPLFQQLYFHSCFFHLFCFLPCLIPPPTNSKLIVLYQ